MTTGGKDASPGNLSLLFLSVKAVALVLFRSQDVSPSFDKPRLIEQLPLKLYRQLHVVRQDCISYIALLRVAPTKGACTKFNVY